MSTGQIIVISGAPNSGKTELGDLLMAQYGRALVRRFEYPRDSLTEICQTYAQGNVCIVETELSPLRLRMRASSVITVARGRLEI